MRSRIFVVAGIWMVLHAYVGARLLDPLGLSGTGLALAWSALLLVALAPLGAFFTLRAEQHLLTRAMQWAGFTAVGLSSLLIVFVCVTDLLFVRAWGVDAETLGVTILGGAAALTAAGTWQARRPRIVRIAIPIASLPADLEGFRIVQLSDLHVGPTIRRRFVQTVVDAANGLDADVVALTGDVADGMVAGLRREVAPLADLQARYGKFFVSGNHESYWDPAGWLGEVERLGFNVLANAHRMVGRGGGRLLLAGVTDASASHRVPGGVSDPARAIAGAPPADVRVLLAHQPRSAFAALAAGFDLQISGHTHGGQFFPFSLLVRLFQPFVAGLHRLEEMWLYVSRGTGYWGPPLRLGAPSEITLIELRAAS
jgi:predicted MPP superfamily phosphohydrolase